MLLIDRIFAFLAPYDCLICGQEGQLLCQWCLPEAYYPLPPRCYRCRKLTVDSSVCESCRSTVALKHVWVATGYEGAVQQLIHYYKFERARDVASVLAEIIAEALPHSGDMLVSYVPTATSRVRSRGYDHAKVLAAAYAKLHDKKAYSLLRRQGQKRQVGAKRALRIKQMEKAFSVSKAELLKGKHVLLIDDLVTTGASLDSAARILKAAGAKSVSALVIAQKQ